MGVLMTGCKALEGCEKRQQCFRYYQYIMSTPYAGWSSFQQCRVSEFTEKHYTYFVPMPEHVITPQRD